MKKLIAILLIVLLPYISFAGMANDEWSGQDKTLHLGVSALISGTITTYCIQKGNMKPWKAALVGIGVSAIVGIIKEVSDSPRSGFSYKDLTWGVGGGMLGAVIVIPFNYNGKVMPIKDIK